MMSMLMAGLAMVAVQGGGPGGPLPPLPFETGALTLALHMVPERPLDCRADGAGTPAWTTLAGGLCSDLAQRMGENGPRMEMQVTMQVSIARSGEAAPVLTAPEGEPVQSGQADVTVDAAGSVTACTPVGGTEPQMCRMFRRGTPFLPAEGAARSGRLNMAVYMTGPMADMIRERRQNRGN